MFFSRELSLVLPHGMWDNIPSLPNNFTPRSSNKIWWSKHKNTFWSPMMRRRINFAPFYHPCGAASSCFTFYPSKTLLLVSNGTCVWLLKTTPNITKHQFLLPLNSLYVFSVPPQGEHFFKIIIHNCNRWLRVSAFPTGASIRFRHEFHTKTEPRGHHHGKSIWIGVAHTLTCFPDVLFS